MKLIASLMTLAFLFVACKLETPLTRSNENIPDLQIIFEGDYLNLLTSGDKLKTGRHKKSGVWNTPARKVKEMWVQRVADPKLVRLDPHRFQGQLVELLPEFPEVHGYIERKDLTYKNLSEAVQALDEHVKRVCLIRQEQRQLPALDLLK